MKKDRPFYVLEDAHNSIFVACHDDDGPVRKMIGISVRSETDAHKVVDALNDLWSQREKRSCRECAFMGADEIRCHKQHEGDYAISCNEWEPE